MSQNSTEKPAAQAYSWRAVLKVHPACESVPPIGAAELRELMEDLQKHGLRSPIVIIEKMKPRPDGTFHVGDPPMQIVLDGRSRLDALQLAGFKVIGKDGRLDPTLGHKGAKAPQHLDEYWTVFDDSENDPVAFVKSVNVHRRHLTAGQKRDAIAELLKVNPTRSDRQIAEMVKASPTVVGKVRAEKEATGDVSTVDTRIDKRGRSQPAHPKREEPNRRVSREAANNAASLMARSIMNSRSKQSDPPPQVSVPGPASGPPLPLSDLIRSEWTAARSALESLSRHPVAQVAVAIPPNERELAGALATELAGFFSKVASALRPPADRPQFAPDGSLLHCSFCHKTNHEVRKLIVGPKLAGQASFICDRCVDLCADVIREEAARAEKKASAESTAKSEVVVTEDDKTVPVASAPTSPGDDYPELPASLRRFH
jgi:hypothetical protein